MTREEKLQKAIEEIASLDLGIDTLEAQNSDSLDFHDLAIWNIKEALENAYKAGRDES